MRKHSMIRVLVVEDYKPWQDLIRSLIEGADGFRLVGMASDGLAAVQQSNQLQPDLILLDLGLPGMNGIEAAQQIRRNCPRSQILFVSENRDADITDAAMAAGAVDYVVKSSVSEELLPLLNALRWSLSQNATHLVKASQRSGYEEIVDAALALMRSDFASMQMLYPERGAGGELRLLAFRGFNPQAARSWEWIRVDSKTTCGIALRNMQRVVAPDICTCGLFPDLEVQKAYLQTGIRACQTTPLISPAGNVIGMLSTHWRTPHQPSEQDFRLFDILATHAADLIECCNRGEESGPA